MPVAVLRGPVALVQPVLHRRRDLQVVLCRGPPPAAPARQPSHRRANLWPAVLALMVPAVRRPVAGPQGSQQQTRDPGTLMKNGSVVTRHVVSSAAETIQFWRTLTSDIEDSGHVDGLCCRPPQGQPPHPRQESAQRARRYPANSPVRCLASSAWCIRFADRLLALGFHHLQ